jgi:hypothetical protein
MTPFNEFRSAVENNDAISAFKILSTSTIAKDERYKFYIEHAVERLEDLHLLRHMARVRHKQGTIGGLKVLFGCKDIDLLLQAALPYLARNHGNDTVVTYGGAYFVKPDRQWHMCWRTFERYPAVDSIEKVALATSLYSEENRHHRYGSADVCGIAKDIPIEKLNFDVADALEYSKRRLLTDAKAHSYNKSGLFSLYTLVYLDEVCGMMPKEWKSTPPNNQVALL